MIPPSALEGMPENIAKQFRLLEERTMADIVRRLKNNGNDVIRSADWQIHRLQELGKSREEIKKYIQNALSVSESEADKIFADAAEQSYVYDKNDYSGVSELVPFEENGELQQLTKAIHEQTAAEFQNITRSMGFAVKQPDGTTKFKKIADYYQQTLDGAMLDIASGNFDYNTVLKRIVNEMTNSGLRTVDYASGHSNRIDVAARRAVMTGVSQLTGKINEANAEALGTDMYEVSWHSGARPSHMEWQGKWFTKAELESVCGLGSVTGLCGANCYHSYSPVIPGISKPTYTAEELAQMNAEEMKPTEYGDKKYTKYEALQRQRKLETTMRAQRQKIKLLEDGGANEDDIITARCRYRATSDEYTRFSKAMNLPQQRERVYIDGLGNVGNGKTKIDLTHKSYKDIMFMKGKMSNVDVRRWYVAHNKAIPDLIDTTRSIEEQARQACNLRNKYKFQARELMEDQEKRKELDISDPIESFEIIVKRKMTDKNMSYEEAVQDILKTATKTRKSVNDALGVEG